MSTDGFQVAATEKDVVFGQGGGRDLRCDIYRPLAGTDKRTALIHFHGGGFRRGSKEMVADKAPYFSSRGHLCIAAEYRLADEAKWPAQIEDVKACIRWARANADYQMVVRNKTLYPCLWSCGTRSFSPFARRSPPLSPSSASWRWVSNPTS